MLPGSFTLGVFSQQIFENCPHQIFMGVRRGMINKWMDPSEEQRDRAARTDLLKLRAGQN